VKSVTRAYLDLTEQQAHLVYLDYRVNQLGSTEVVVMRSMGYQDLQAQWDQWDGKALLD
jgi:hypothetical protein